MIKAFVNGEPAPLQVDGKTIPRDMQDVRALVMAADWECTDAGEQVPPQLRSVIPSQFRDSNGNFKVYKGDEGFYVESDPSEQWAWVIFVCNETSIHVVVPLNRVSLGAKYISRADQLQAEPANVGQSQVLDLNMDINVKVTGKSHDPKRAIFSYQSLLDATTQAINSGVHPGVKTLLQQTTSIKATDIFRCLTKLTKESERDIEHEHEIDSGKQGTHYNIARKSPKQHRHTFILASWPKDMGIAIPTHTLSCAEQTFALCRIEYSEPLNGFPKWAKLSVSQTVEIHTDHIRQTVSTVPFTTITHRQAPQAASQEENAFRSQKQFGSPHTIVNPTERPGSTSLFYQQTEVERPGFRPAFLYLAKVPTGPLRKLAFYWGGDKESTGKLVAAPYDRRITMRGQQGVIIEESDDEERSDNGEDSDIYSLAKIAPRDSPACHAFALIAIVWSSKISQELHCINGCSRSAQ
ncbi:hypothetical protein CC79DRAFT_1382063 [Sarocladium strictum]